ncbi:lipopolysaccharide heptosyltransferase II [candidate division KSB1 bacterium]|nr:lipopolysaccharide heptosyltransferase II [candidate division KSB1 bacterium]
MKRHIMIKFCRSLIKKSFEYFLRLQTPYLLKNRTIKDENIREILILAYIGIGDMIMFTPALKLLRQKFPHAKITFQTGLKNSCEKVIQNSNLIDEIDEVVLDQKFFKFIRHGWRKRNRYQLLIADFHHGFYELAFQILYMNIPIRIGHTSSPGFKSAFDFLYNYKIQMQEAEHTILRNLKLLTPIGIDFDIEKELQNTSIYISSEDMDFANRYWDEIKLNQEYVIGVQAGTAPLGRWKQWPLEHFQKLIQELQNAGKKVILFGSPGERAMLENLARSITPQPLLFAGAGSFIQSCALIQKCQYMIANDSGLMHVANALGVPLLAIYGPTDYRRTAPLAKTSKILRLGLPCSPCFKLEGDEAVINCPIQIECLRKIQPEQILKELNIPAHLT